MWPALCLSLDITCSSVRGWYELDTAFSTDKISLTIKKPFPTKRPLSPLFLAWLYKRNSNFFIFSYFRDGLKTIDHFGTYIQELTVKLSHIRTHQDDEKRSLIEIRNSLKNSPGFNKMVSSQYLSISHLPSPLLYLRSFFQIGNLKPTDFTV